MQPNIHFEKSYFSAGNFRTGVSLHSHTLHSREPLSSIDAFAQKNGLLRLAFASVDSMIKGMNGGRAPDLNRVYWTPPLAPHDAWMLEHDHIQKRFGLRALVSLTDHDSIDAPMTLRVLDSFRQFPISLEWTVPYRETFFHLGLHNIRPEFARRTMDELKAFTASPDERALPELLGQIASDPAALVVFNHPLWDEKGLGQTAHRSHAAEFCRRYGARIHALELNGLRPWKENKDVMVMASEMGRPVISGGDRHGLEPNATLNLTQSSTFSEFVAEIRSGLSEVLFTNHYFEPFPARILQSAQDVVADHENHGRGWVRWSDRVFYIGDDGEHRALSALWHHPPAAIKMFEAGLRALCHPWLRVAFRALAGSEAAL
jgi:hypothetical protein